MVQAYADPGSALARGIESGTSLALAVFNAREQRRQKEIENGMNRALIALEISKSSMPDNIKTDVMNKSFVPFMQQNYKMDIQPFTAEDFKDKQLMDTSKQALEIIGDKSLSHDVKSQGWVGVWSEYMTAKGKAKETMELQSALVKGELKPDKKDQPKIPEIPDILKRQTTLFEKVGQIAKGRYFDEATRQTIDLSQNPALKKQIIGQVVGEVNKLNRYLPEGDQRMVVTQSEIDANARYKNMTPMARAKWEEFVRSGRVVVLDDR